MRSFVINLDSATERLAWMVRAFERMDVRFERVAAIDRQSLPDETFRRVVGSGHWARAEIACFLSHIELWKRIAAGNDPYAAIFEDDVHFASEAASFLKNCSWIPAGVDVVKLETTLHPVRTGRPSHSVMGHRLQVLKGFHSGSAGYIISKQAAAGMIAASQAITQPVDDFIFDMGHGFACWQVIPALCIQDMFLPQKKAGLPSGIGPDRDAARTVGPWRPRRSLSARIAREVRRLSWKIQRLPSVAVPIEL